MTIVTRIHFYIPLAARGILLALLPVVLSPLPSNVSVASPVLAVTCFLPVSQIEESDRPKNSSATIQELLRSLDGARYQQRQQAARQLSAMGEEALIPLALRGLDATPETSWRVRQILEEIGKAGDESTFYKSTGILKLLYPVDEDGTRRRIEELRLQWRLARKQKAIEKLRALGAKVEDPLSQVAQSDTDRLQWMMANQGMFNNQGAIVVVQSSTNPKAEAKKQLADSRIRHSFSELNPDELRKQVEEIIQSDLATNRERILGTVDRKTSNNPTAANSVQGFNARQAFASNRFRLGVTIEFDQDFQGSPEELLVMSEIRNVTAVAFSGRDIDPAEMNILAQQGSISAISFKACRFPDAPLPKSAWPRLASNVSFTDQKITADILSGFRGSVLSSLTLTNCSLSPDAHQELRKLESINELVIRETQVGKTFFETFAAIKSLTRIDLSLCKFATHDYRELMKSRRTLRIDFTPQAFLGIRSSPVPRLIQPRLNDDAPEDPFERRMNNRPVSPAVRENTQGCEVGQVIAGSGAERGGLQPGDWIETINDQPVEAFEDLRLHVAQHRVGETLRIQIRRAGKSQDIEIKLGPFPRNVAR